MVQQQFIISELSNESEDASEQESSIVNHQLETVEVNAHGHFEGEEIPNDTNDEFPVPYSRGFSSNKISFAIFGTFKDQFVLEESKQYKQYVTSSLSGFRLMSMVKPDYSHVLLTLLSCEGFREDAQNLQKQVSHYFAVLENISELNINPSYKDLWWVCKIARTISLRYLDDNFVPKLKNDEKNESKEGGLSKASKGYHMFEQELKAKQKKMRIQVEEYALKEALDIFSRNKYKATFILKHSNSEKDPEDRFDYWLEEAKEKCMDWKIDKNHQYDDLEFENNDQLKSKEENKANIPSDEEEDKFEPDDVELNNDMAYRGIVSKYMQANSYSRNMILIGKVLNIMKWYQKAKGIVIAGPRCSGKTTILKWFGHLLKESDHNVEMKLSVLNPDVYSLDQLYGSADSGVMHPEISTKKDVKISSITSNVLKIALKGFESLTKKRGKIPNLIE